MRNLIKKYICNMVIFSLTVASVLTFNTRAFAAEVAATSAKETLVIGATINGETISKTLKNKCIIETGKDGISTFYLPLRETCETLGMKVTYNAKDKTVTVIGSNIKTWTVKASKIIDGNTYVDASDIPTYGGLGYTENEFVGVTFNEKEVQVITIKG